MHSIRSFAKSMGNPYYERLTWFMIITNENKKSETKEKEKMNIE